MLTVSKALHHVRTNLNPLYGERESAAQARELLAFLVGGSHSSLLAMSESPLTPVQTSELERALRLLEKAMPLQYVIGQAWFYGMRFIVSPAVLIPRPETEELVCWIVADVKSNQSESLTIWDACTGSGCIAIALKAHLKHANVQAFDISSEALQVAKENATLLDAPVYFHELDLLHQILPCEAASVNIIVSNPPYVPYDRRDSLDRNVRDYEPDIALFVPSHDPLIFYRALAATALKYLAVGGNLYVEVDAAFASDCGQLLINSGYGNVSLKADFSGNLRMIRATKVSN